MCMTSRARSAARVSRSARMQRLRERAPLFGGQRDEPLAPFAQEIRNRDEGAAEARWKSAHRRLALDDERERLAAADAQRGQAALRFAVAPWRRAAWSRTRAPLAPMGCPSATAPPRTLTLADRARRLGRTAMATHREGLVDLEEVDLGSVSQPASRACARWRRAGAVVNHSGACAAPP